MFYLKYRSIRPAFQVDPMQSHLHNLLQPKRTTPLLTAKRTEAGDITYFVNEKVNPMHSNVLNTTHDLTNKKKAIECAIVKCATSLIPMQGYLMIMTNHHYLSATKTQPQKLCMVIEKAY
ncbi:hypothetical protein NC653_008267 [Populus alba x Populus x berolinensis]|uniref:Uncharacterized protein n=1 Tax=Populus alba x Populus x berolinensis TaxID=444605 RepID=A0AAD6R600_9ROSI|nr:hypothetical protein NC653_008267 [Populus alba x Populus x berolinensis]